MLGKLTGEDVFVVVHWFNGDIESETFDVAVGPRVTAEQLRLGNSMEETDKLYRLTSHG